MGGLFLSKNADESALAAAEAQFRLHGFTDFRQIDAGEYRGFHAPPFHGGPESFLSRGDDYVAVAGTLSYDGKLGTPALEALLADFSFPFQAWEKTGGQFVLLVRKAGRVHLLTDFFGAFQLYRSTGNSLFSSSFLAAAKSLDRLSFDPQGVYEFGFNVFPTGNDSVFNELKRLGPGVQLQLAPRFAERSVEKPLPRQTEELPLAERVQRTAETLRSIVAPFAAYYGGRMQCPLSGGLDSRLLLGLLRDAGVAPHVYVYGRPGDEDVEIARRVAGGEGFPIEIFEKSKHAAIAPDQFAEIVERNFLETDALITDGGLFDNGGNAAARHARQRGGQLAVSGGCGEVLRNFFFLPDRPMTARQLVGAFFARFTRADVTGEFDSRRFLRNLENKALAAVGEEGAATPLPRTVIEQLYPRMRCRAFFGREISVVGRQGGYLMPFFDQALVSEALTLPLELKNAGLFEGMLLNHIDPKLASYQSGYGHAFDEPPSRAQQLTELGTRVRPAWMRRRSYALRRRLGSMADEHGGLLTPAYMGRVLDLHFPHMSRFFQVPNIDDSGLYRRVATLEYLGQHLEDRLA